jgi:hypothetical protein
MARKLTLSLVLALLALPVAAGPAGAVSGGTDLPIAQAPFIAWLDGRCTGTLVSPTRILTAGHCVAGHDANGYRVLVGIDGSKASPSQRAKHALAIAGFTVHPRFREAFPFAHDSPENAIAIDDVGLILLKKPVKGVTPVKLGTAAPGTAVTLAGYGQIAPETQGGLEQGALTVIGPAACSAAYPNAIRPQMICTQDLAQHPAPLVQACAGDSGGPVLAGGAQIGITSWGPETLDGLCGEKPLPMAAMRTSSYTSFIDARHPVIEPFSTGSGIAKIVGAAHVGKTVSCQAPKLGGPKAKLTYGWQVANGAGIVGVKGARHRTLKITSAVYKQADVAKRLFCTATATNKGGSVGFSSGSAGMKK